MFELRDGTKIRTASVCFVVIAALGAAAILAQEKSEYSSLVPERGTRIPGAVDIIIDGKLQLKDARDILAIGQKTKFNEVGSYERKHEGGSIEYVPPAASQDAIRTAFTQGLLLYKLTIKGTPPRHINLSPGTYYFFMQYVNGRWVGVAVDQAGKSRCLTFGLIPREIFTVHPGRDHLTGSHVKAHAIASGENLAKFGGLRAADAGWVDVQIGWEPFGAGCWKQIVCVPTT